MNSNVSELTKSKFNDFYNEILNAHNSKGNTIKSSIEKGQIRQQLNSNKQRNKSIEAQEVSSPPNSKLNRAKSQICNLLGEDDVFNNTKYKKEYKETGRVFQMKTELNQILKKNHRNRKSSVDNVNYLSTSTNEFISKAKIEKNKKKQMKDDCYYAHAISFGGSNRKNNNNNNINFSNNNTIYSLNKDYNALINDKLDLKVRLEMTKI